MRALAFVLLAVLSTSLWAEYVMYEVRHVPVERLAANLARQARQNPRDLEVRVNLARVHAMAYAQKLSEFPVFKGYDLDGLLRLVHGRDEFLRVVLMPDELVHCSPLMYLDFEIARSTRVGGSSS